jgi:hypothetical protein
MMTEAVPAVEPVEPEWIWMLLGASRRLAVASVSLLVGAFFFLVRLDPFGFSFLVVLLATMAGFVLQLLGWAVLSDAAISSAMRVTFRSSLVGFAVGIALILYLVPESGLFVLFGGWLLLPYMPFVFGPVAIAHAFLLYLFFVRLGSKSPRLIVASLGLAAVAVIGIVLQLGLVLQSPALGIGDLSAPTWVIVFAGLASAGYGIAALEFQSEYENRQVHLAPFLGTESKQQSP